MNLPPDLSKIRDEIKKHAKGYGLDFYDVIFEVLDWKEMNEVAALGGFPNRYPHWRFGMEYESITKSYAYGLSKIYEMVINNDPCYAYLLYCNNLVDQKIVMAHVYGHCDFFKNNVYFAHTNRKMMDEMANHRTRVIRCINRYGHDKVEDFIDACLSIDSLIDIHASAIKRQKIEKREEDEEDIPVVRKLRSKPYLDKFINPPDFLEAEQEKIRKEIEKERKIPESPARDVVGFLLEHAPLEPWERDILSIICEEAYYFAPQAQTKILNEGWACVVGDTLVSTEHGFIKAKEIAENKYGINVNDGQSLKSIYDWAIFPQKKVILIETKRGLKLSGSTTHQIKMADGSWKSLGDVKIGETVKIGVEKGVWPKNMREIDFKPQRRMTLSDVANDVGVNISTVIRHKTGVCESRSAGAIDAALARYEQETTYGFMCNSRHDINVPEVLDERLAAFLGYLVGDGHISKIKRVLGLTSGDYEQANCFAELGESLFGLEPRVKKDGGRYRVLFHSEDLSDFLVNMGLKHGVSSRRKDVPDAILRSPKKVVAAFIRAYFDCDAYAGPGGIRLSTSSPELCSEIQQLLLNFGILSSKIDQPKDIFQLCIFGSSAKKFVEEIDFGLERKKKALRKYLQNRKWFKKEAFEDDIISVGYGVDTVYDFSVAESHQYAASGFINHNSYWHSKIMTQKALHASEFIDYADHHSGTLATAPGQLNPYKIGIELFRNVEERWNKGQFGKEYEDCDDMVVKKAWDKKLGLGREKIFQVRRLYSDVMFIDEFLTPEFCRDHKLFVYSYNLTSDQFEIADRAFDSIKEKLLFHLTNMGRPIIDVVDANYGNRSELLLEHRHEGVDLRVDYGKETLKSLFRIWKRPVNIKTILNGTPKILSFDGESNKEFQP